MSTEPNNGELVITPPRGIGGIGLEGLWAYRELLAQGAPPGAPLLVSVSVSLALFATGLPYFKRMERSFSDVV